MTVRVVGYIRVSSEGQAKDGEGLAVQAETIRAWAKREGHKLTAIREDPGVSGANGIEDRIGLPEAMLDLKFRRADAMVVARMDRLARSVTVQEGILAKIWQLDAELISVDMGGVVPRDDPSDPMRTAMRQIVAVFAELDRRMIVKRLKDGREAKAAAGGFAGGGIPYGLTVRDGQPVPDPEEAAIVALVHRLRGEGLSYREVGESLAAAGYTPRRGTVWHAATVRQIALRA